MRYLIYAVMWLSPLAIAASEHVSVKLVADHETIAAQQSFSLAIRMDMKDHWHTYWENPGSSGLPTTVNWTLPEGLELSALLFPNPTRFVDAAGFVTYGYDKTTYLIVDAKYTGSDPSISIKGVVEWLECKEICIPGQQDVSLTLNVGDPSPTSLAKSIQDARSKIPTVYGDEAPFSYASKTEMVGDTWTGTIQLTAKTADWSPSQIEYFPGPNPNGELKNHATRRQDDHWIVELDYNIWEENVADDLEMFGVLIFDDGESYKIPVYPNKGEISAVAKASNSNRKGMLLILFMAFIGGIILNLMPCVLPVLSLKILSFIQEAGESRARRMQFGWVYTLGIMVSFLLLSAAIIALKMTGERVGIGFQFQNASFVVFMIVLLFVMGLSFFGVFTLNPPQVSGLTGLTTKQGLSGAFFNGILMTLLSTPCTAPLLGAAYGWAMSAEYWQLLVVFQAVAIGLAAPYLLLCSAPYLLKFLPKPGPWMDDFKVFMGFPLLATCVWLLWVLGTLEGSKAIIATLTLLVFLAISLWLVGKSLYGKKKVLGLSFALLLAFLGGWLGLRINAPSNIEWTPYTAEQLASLRGADRLVFLDFTAEWCTTCKFNEKLVIDTQAVRNAFAQNEVATVKVDYTHYDQEITRMLNEFERAGVPLYVIYPGSGEPIVLPEVITQSMVLAAVKEGSARLNQMSQL